MDKKLNTRDSELLRKVRVLKLSDNWPFRSVSADEFVKASTPLIEMLRNSDDRLIGNKNASPEMYMDRTIEATIIMLRCVHKMQFEAYQATTLQPRSVQDCALHHPLRLSQQGKAYPFFSTIPLQAS